MDHGQGRRDSERRLESTVHERLEQAKRARIALGDQQLSALRLILEETPIMPVEADDASRERHSNVIAAFDMVKKVFFFFAQ